MWLICCLSYMGIKPMQISLMPGSAARAATARSFAWSRGDASSMPLLICPVSLSIIFHSPSPNREMDALPPMRTCSNVSSTDSTFQPTCGGKRVAALPPERVPEASRRHFSKSTSASQPSLILPPESPALRNVSFSAGPNLTRQALDSPPKAAGGSKGPDATGFGGFGPLCKLSVASRRAGCPCPEDSAIATVGLLEGEGALRGPSDDCVPLPRSAPSSKLVSFQLAGGPSICGRAFTGQAAAEPSACNPEEIR
mmetsp:Transcript_25391/g.70670  ORF Transcript_25391/g.70670 Transcript_25391/m.70670 type:complete len:254 (+) Transcript_25391:758-1519(+)